MITLTQGDAIPLTLTCTGLDLTGATITTRFKTAEETDVVIPNSQHTPDADQSANRGKFVVALTATNTNQMVEGTELSIITTITQGSSIIHFHGKKILTVKKATLR